MQQLAYAVAYAVAYAIAYANLRRAYAARTRIAFKTKKEHVNVNSIVFSFKGVSKTHHVCNTELSLGDLGRVQ